MIIINNGSSLRLCVATLQWHHPTWYHRNKFNPARHDSFIIVDVGLESIDLHIHLHITSVRKLFCNENN